jgi:hypothetical protein
MSCKIRGNSRVYGSSCNTGGAAGVAGPAGPQGPQGVPGTSPTIILGPVVGTGVGATRELTAVINGVITPIATLNRLFSSLGTPIGYIFPE